MDTKHTHSTCCAPATTTADARTHSDQQAHDHAAHSRGNHTHEDGHDHDHGHDHGVLPGWPRISAALVMALLAEVSHWFTPQYPALEYVGMVLAVVAIGLSGLGVYKAGLKNLDGRGRDGRLPHRPVARGCHGDGLVRRRRAH